MHAFLIASNQKPIIELEVQKILKKQNAKLISFVLQKIEDARDLKKLVKFSFADKTAILINNIDLATNEALNAFLKNLEEPNKNIIYILTALNTKNVLPTIASRCQIIKTANAKQSITSSEDFKSSLNIKDREEAIKFIENLVLIDHQKGDFKNMGIYLNTIKNLKANCNVSLQLTYFVARMSNKVSS